MSLSRFATDPASPLPASDPGDPLRRFLRPREQVGEVCELCAEPIGEDHRHVVDLDLRGIQCTCRGCGLLFVDVGAGRYRTVPERYRRVERFALSPQQWASLQIPVGVVFIVENSQLRRSVAFYPSPGGATESELPLAAWEEIARGNPSLGDVAADVEAVLIRSDREATECFVVPVDRCYELVGTLRMHWHGFDGGAEVRAAMAEFFDDVSSRSRIR